VCVVVLNAMVLFAMNNLKKSSLLKKLQ